MTHSHGLVMRINEMNEVAFFVNCSRPFSFSPPSPLLFARWDSEDLSSSSFLSGVLSFFLVVMSFHPWRSHL
jgi:hypothetical protein